MFLHCLVQRCYVTSCNVFGFFWQSRIEIHWVLLKFGIGWECQGENNPSEKSDFLRQRLGTAVYKSVIWGPALFLLYFL